MSRYHSYLNSATTILDSYDGAEPFASHLKKFFAEHKKFGSRDRKQVGHLCYCYFRLGKALPAIPKEEKLLLGIFLCGDGPNEILQALKPEWNDAMGQPLQEKLKLAGYTMTTVDMFPWKRELSTGIDEDPFILSHLQQPLLFLRLRPGKESIARQKLSSAAIAFENISEHCLALSNASKIDTLIELDKDAVVQDMNSQRVGEFMGLLTPKKDRVRKDPQGNPLVRETSAITVWDCCAASGGKSILASDILGDIDLTVSDIRESILANLKKRFARAGIGRYKNYISDLANGEGMPEDKYDLIIADVPCSGSGTWGRTPEQMLYFDEKKISEYAVLQRKIVSNVVDNLQVGGYLLYITCSVFAKENEEQVSFLQEKFHLQLVKMESLKGYSAKADTLFAALLQKTL